MARYVGRQRAYSNLKADIEDIIATCEKRLMAVMRQSLQDVTLEASLATAKGGRMRVDTGFLRASGMASLTGMPSGPVRPPDDALPGSFVYDEGAQVMAALANMEMGDTFHYGWTAEYARYRELYDGFLEGALQHWPRIVAFNTDSVRQRIK